MKRGLIYILCLFFICILFSSCATQNKEYLEPTLKPITFEDTDKELTINFDELEKLETEPPNFIYLKKINDTIYVECNDDEATHVSLSSEELDKIERLVDLKNAYKKISNEEYDIIKLQEKKIEILKDLVIYEREGRISEEKIKLNYEQAYEKEIKRRNFDNITYKVLLLLSIAGNIF